MKTRKYTTGMALALVTALAFGQTSLAEVQEAPDAEALTNPAEALTNPVDVTSRQYQMEHKFEKAEQYFLEFNPGAKAEDFEKLRPWLKPFTDVEIMADMFTDPRKMMQWMNAVSEPDAVYLMMKCSTEPVMWDTWMHGMTDFPKLTRAMLRFMEPTTYINWMVGWFDPNMYVNMMAMLDPNKYVRWANVSANPKFYEPMFAFFDPNWYTPRLQWMLDPQSFQPVLNVFAIPTTATN